MRRASIQAPRWEGAGGSGGEVRDSQISSLSVVLFLAGFSSLPSLILIGSFIVEPPLRFQAFWGEEGSNTSSVTRAGGTEEDNMPPLSLKGPRVRGKKGKEGMSDGSVGESDKLRACGRGPRDQRPAGHARGSFLF